MVKGVGTGRQEQDQGSEDTDTGNVYLLADPRLVEAPDNGTIVHPAGAEHSAPGTLQGPNPPHSQSMTGEGQGGRKRAASDTGSSSRSGNSVKANHESTSAKVVLAKWRQQSG